MVSDKLEKYLHAAPSLVLPASRLKWFGVFAGSAMFVAGGVWMLQDPEIELWKSLSATGFFGLCALVSLPILLFPTSYALILEPRHFTINHLGRKSVYEWKNVSQFVALRMPEAGDLMNKANVTSSHFGSTPIAPGRTPVQVFFDDQTARGKSADFMRGRMGVYGMLPDNYGFKPEDLAALMNHWREKER